MTWNNWLYQVQHYLPEELNYLMLPPHLLVEYYEKDFTPKETVYDVLRNALDHTLK